MRLVDADAIIQMLPYSPEEMSITSVLSQEKPKYITPTVMMVRSVISIIQNTPTATPWVKTSDRLPAEAEAGYNEEVVALYRDGDTETVGCHYWKYVAKHPEYFPCWMPLPKLPEVEE